MRPDFRQTFAQVRLVQAEGGDLDDDGVDLAHVDHLILKPMVANFLTSYLTKLECFYPDKPFLSSVMFASKADPTWVERL